MAVKIGNNDITLKLGSSDVTAAYIGDTLVYSGGTPPTFQGKWLATYQDSHTESAECDSSSAITDGEIAKANLVSVEIGDCVTSIGSNAFASCRSLTSIDIPNSVTTIGENAFANCRNLTSIDIPSGVRSISDLAFRNCSSLISVTVNATTPPTLDFAAFDSTNYCPIYVPCESVEAYKTATNWSEYASRIQAIPNS